MTIHWRALGGALAALALAGCAAITPVPAGPLALGDNHSVTLNRMWSDVSNVLPGKSAKVKVLSIDGPLLNRVYVVQGLAPGEGLLTAAAKEHPVPTFHADMSATELVEFVSDSVTAAGYQRVETSKLRPAKFGTAGAVRFDIAAKTATGLEMQGAAEVAAAGGKLYLVLYLAPAEHYYATTLPDVEAIMNSAT